MNLLQNISFLQNISKKKLIGIIGILVITVAIVLTVIVAQQQQELRQRATGEQVSLYFAKDNCSNPAVTSLSEPIGSTITMLLCLNTNSYLINSFNLEVNLGNIQSVATINSEAEGDGARLFNAPIYRTTTGNTRRFAKATTEGTSNIQGANLALATMNLTTTTAGTGTVTVTKAELTTPTNTQQFVSVVPPSVTYTVTAGPTATTGPTSGPTITLPISPTAPVACPTTPPCANGQLTQITPPASIPSSCGPQYACVTPSASPSLTSAPTITTSPTPVSCTVTLTACDADIDLNGYVQGLDRSALNSCVNQPKPTSGPCSRGDYNGNNRIDLEDVVCLGTQVGNGCPSHITPTATPVPGATVLRFKLVLQALGTYVNRANRNPLTPTRELKVELFDAQDNAVLTQPKTGNIQYQASGPNAGLFTGDVDMGVIQPGNYTVKISSPHYLRKRVPGIYTITSAATPPIQVPQLQLYGGDLIVDNRIDTLDYEQLRQCYDDVFRGRPCRPPEKKDLVDMDNNGTVNEQDLYWLSANLLLIGD